MKIGLCRQSAGKSDEVYIVSLGAMKLTEVAKPKPKLPLMESACDGRSVWQSIGPGSR